MSPQEFECCASSFRNQLERIECAARLVLIYGKEIREAARTYEVLPEEVEDVVRSYLEIRAHVQAAATQPRVSVHAIYCTLEQAA